MLTAIATKIAVVVALGGLFGYASIGPALPSTDAPSVQNAGTFGGPVTRIGRIERDVEPACSLQRIPCAGGALPGMTCYAAPSIEPCR